jgi:hypothetical protein
VNKYTNILYGNQKYECWAKEQRFRGHFRFHHQSWCTEWPQEASHILATYCHLSLQPRLIYIGYVWSFITSTLRMEKVSGMFHCSLTMTRLIAGGSFSAQLCCTYQNALHPPSADHRKSYILILTKQHAFSCSHKLSVPQKILIEMWQLRLEIFVPNLAVLHAEKHHHFHCEITHFFPCSFAAQHHQLLRLTCFQVFSAELYRTEL